MNKKNTKIDIPSVLSLHKEKSSKEIEKFNIYSIVLKKCSERIIYTNRFTDKTFIIFEVPMILIGHPNYDLNGCILYLMKKLKEQKYYVELYTQNLLYIDWGKINYDTESLKSKTAKLLQKYPNVTSVEYIYTNK